MRPKAGELAQDERIALAVPCASCGSPALAWCRLVDDRAGMFSTRQAVAAALRSPRMLHVTRLAAGLEAIAIAMPVDVSAWK